MSIDYSEIESKRFGLRIYRGQYESFTIKDLEKIVQDNSFDIIIVRYPTTTIYEHFQLAKFKGCKTIHADSLLYYTSPLQRIEVKPLRNNLQFEVVTPETSSRLDSIIESIFAGYKNHYFANPCLNKMSIVEGYVEWAKSFVRNTENGITWLVKDKDSKVDVAFQACYFDEKDSISDLKLGGVLPEFAKRGYYADILSYSQEYFKNMGLNSLITSTQLQNVAVRRVWERYGFEFERSYETYHIINQNIWDKMVW